MKILLRVSIAIFCIFAPIIRVEKPTTNEGCVAVVNVEAGAIYSNFSAITLYPIILTVDYDGSDPFLLKHESVHCRQVSKEGTIAFYYNYLRHYFRNRLKGMDKQMAYAAIPYEIEARKLARGHK